MMNSQIKKIEAVTPKTLIVGVDIAKNIQWAQFTDFRGREGLSTLALKITFLVLKVY